MFPVLECLAQFVEGQLAPDFKASQLRLVLRFDARSDLFEVLAHRFVDAFGQAEDFGVAGGGDTAMKLGQLLRQ